jgi:hypothetical protein
VKKTSKNIRKTLDKKNSKKPKNSNIFIGGGPTGNF